MANVLGTDVSFYEDNPETIRHIDFVKMKQTCGFTFIRAGQNTWVDPSFATNWRLAKEASLPRGSYWFYDSRSSPQAQAKLWFDTMKGDYGELPLCADYEENYNGQYKGASNFMLFMHEVRRLIPQQEIIIYTGYYYWKDNVPISFHPYFNQFALWIAHYGAVTPNIPAPWKTWLFWQFSESGSGAIYGTEGAVDLNWFNGDYDTFVNRFKIGNIPPVDTDKHIQTHTGVMCHILNRFGTKCVVHVIDPKIVEVYVTSSGFSTVGDAVRTLGADGGVNGGGWPNVQTPTQRSNEVWVSEGKYLQTTAIDNRGFMNVGKDGSAFIRETDSNISGLYNTWGFDRIVVKESMFNPLIADRTTKDARTGAGITADGKVVLLSVEGNDRYNVGFTFPEMSSVLIEFGCITAGNNDGGSSSACWNTAIDTTKSLIVPSDGAEARVINHVLFFANKGVPPMPVPQIPTVVGKARFAANIKTVDGVPSGAVASLPVDGLIYGDWNAGKTDIMYGRSKDGLRNGFYRPTGEFVEWSEAIKAGATNLTVTAYTPMPIPPDPEPIVWPPSFILENEVTHERQRYIKE